MEELEIFLATKNDINNVVLFIGECGIERVEEIFNYTNIDNCIVVCPWSKFDINRLHEELLNDGCLGRVFLPKKLTLIPYYEFSGVDASWCLCPVNSKAEDIIKLLDFKPTYIVGSVFDGTISAFSIWERARYYVEEVHIKTQYSNKPDLSLDWIRDAYDKELSIIFPVYNVASYLEKCIESVINWKADYVEYLFVSDGSKDESVSIIKRYAEIDNRIRLIEKENGGCASARQVGLEQSKGRYVTFFDPDDFADINMHRKLLKAAMEGNFDISLCGYNEYYENSGVIKEAEDFIVQPYINGCYDSNKIRELITYSRVAIWRGIYRRDFLKQNNIHFYIDIRRFDDLPFKVETFAFAKSVVMVPENLYYYRLEREGQDVAVNDERLYVHFDIFKHLDESISSIRNLQIIDYYQMCKIQTHRYALEKIQDEYKMEYRKKVCEDLKSLMDVERTCLMATIYLGEEISKECRKWLKG